MLSRTLFAIFSLLTLLNAICNIVIFSMAINYTLYQKDICNIYFYYSFGIYLFVYSISHFLINIFTMIAFRLKNKKFSNLRLGFHILSCVLSLMWCIYPMVYKNQPLSVLAQCFDVSFSRCGKGETECCGLYKCCGLNDYKDYANAAPDISCYSNLYSLFQTTSPQSQLYQTGCKNSIMMHGKRIVMTVISMIILSFLFTISNLILIIYIKVLKKRRFQNDEFIISIENLVRDDIYCIDAHDIS
ncbi:hypothetical protein HZS_3680 [Henneguya salminicola]|nr:hypothetical protein HZS_3680 [Henneguya salminicola]